MKYRMFTPSGMLDEYSLVNELGYVVCVMEHPDKKKGIRIGYYSTPISPQILAGKLAPYESVWEYLAEGDYYEEDMYFGKGIAHKRIKNLALGWFDNKAESYEEDPNLFVTEQVLFGFELY